MKTALASIAFCMVASTATAECYLNEVTNSESVGTIESVKSISKSVVPWRDNQQKCMVTFDAKVGGEWHQGLGSFVFNKDEGKACAVALESGKRQLLEQLFPQDIRSESELVCNDGEPEERSGLEGLTKIAGREFMYESKTCGLFFETVQEGSSLYQYTVVMCEISPNKWVEMDRF